VPTGTLPLLAYDASKGELDFNLDLGKTVTLARPFSLDLVQLLSALNLSSTLQSIAKSLVGVGASGNLTVTADATLHLRLGLDLNTVATGTTTQGSASPSQDEIQSLVLKATAGSFKLSFPFSPTAQNLTAAVATGGTLAKGTYYYVVTALLKGSLETAASAQSSTTLASDGSITLGWAAVPLASVYRVYRGSSSGGETGYFTVNTNSVTDDGKTLTAGTPPGAIDPAVETTQDIPFTTDYKIGRASCR